MDYKEKCKIIDGNPKENKQKTQTNLDLANEVRERGEMENGAGSGE